MRDWRLVVFVLISFAGTVSTQSLSAEIEKARSIKLLQATEKDLRELLGNTSSFMSGQPVFPLKSSRIHVSYASGSCTDEEAYGVDADDWDVVEGRAVVIEVWPREKVTMSQLELGTVKLRKDRLYRGRDDHHIYYNKREGIAVTTHDEYVESVLFFPSQSSNSRLCRDEKIRRYFAKSEWKRDPQPKYACILHNQYANVVALDLDSSDVEATSNSTISVVTTAVDPENDVLTYNYKVTGGKIIGTGARVVWDLTGVPAGTYSIMVGVDDGAGIVGRTVTKTVIVK